jgi:hypothetical protein
MKVDISRGRSKRQELERWASGEMSFSAVTGTQRY